MVWAHLPCGKERRKVQDKSYDPGAKCEDVDLSPIAVGDCELTFSKTFKLLDSILAYDLKDNDAIECSIKSAQGAFSAI